MPEILDTYEDSEKEYLFIIDISGSMSGKKLDETKNAVIECLKQLDEGDKFNIIPFESEFESMNIKSIEYNEENMQKAIKYINELETLGGTEILNPIKFALYEKNVDKIILLFTDGQVGNEDEIIEFVKNNVNKSRIFPFGIDTNVNSSFIKKLARYGNGKSEFIQPDEKIDDKIIRTFARIQTPLLEELQIDCGKNIVIDEIREENSLFNYEFYNVFAKIEKLEDDIKLKGKILNKEYIWKINKENINNTSVDLEVLFAKQEMDRLEEYISSTYEDDKQENYKKMIIELSEKYNINSKYTAFLTIYERKDKILEVPKYQETKLSNKFLKDTIFNMFGMNEYDEEEEVECLDIPSFLRNKKTSNDIVAPRFVIGSKVVNSRSKAVEKKKTKEEILEEKINDYYKIFISRENKSILTFLLYALYYLKNRNNKFNYNDLLKFLEKHKKTILENELYLKLLCLCYKQLDNNRIWDKKETLELMDDYFRKIAETNLKINIEFKQLSENAIQKIVNSNKIIENIDKILEHFLVIKISGVSWWK